MKNILKYIALTVFFIINYYILNYLYINNNVKTYFLIAFILFPIIYFILKIKQNLMKYDNYMITIFICIYLIGSFCIGGFSLYKNIMDLQEPITKNVQICGKSLNKNYSILEGDIVYKYKFSFCDNEDNILLNTSIPVKDDASNYLKVNDNVNVTYFKGTKDVSQIDGNNKTYNQPYLQWYFLIFILIGYVFIHSFNIKNIIYVEEKKLTEEEEYILFLLGKKKVETKETLLDKLKNAISKNKEE